MHGLSELLVGLLVAMSQLTRVRRALEVDAPQCFSLVADAMSQYQSEMPSQQQWETQLLRNPKTSVHVIERLVSRQFVAIGCCATRSRDHGLPMRDHITLLAVNPRYQRRGFGRRLLEHILSTHQDQRCTSLFVRPSNAAAVSLYQELGFRLHRQLRRYYRQPDETALLLVRWRRRQRRRVPLALLSAALFGNKGSAQADIKT